MQILYHARIRTQDQRTPYATALAIQEGTILALGRDDQLLALSRPGDEVRDMQGLTIWPGLIDAHLHLSYYARGLDKIDCETPSREECLRRVAERASKTPPGRWVLGHGWNQNEWQGGFGTAADLDAAAPHNPVYLTAKSLHAGWTNTAGLQAAGVTHSSPDPEGGSFQRDREGNLTGILLESAMETLDRVIPAPTIDELSDLLRKAQKTLWELGLTGVHDFDQADCFSALQRLDLAGELGLRVVKSVPAANLEHAAAVGMRSGFGSDFLRIGSVKLFSDGALGPQTAAMIQPYENNPGNTGMLLMDEEEIVEIGRIAAQAGLSLATHAIGDRANHVVLNAYAQVRDFEKDNHLVPLRHRIEHVQILHPSDMGRLAELGVIASMQPIHATSDMLAADRHWGRRAAYAYAWHTLLDRKTVLAFGSDAPVESPNPFWGLYAAVTRRRLNGAPSNDGWYPDQRLDLAEALRGYTTGAAYAGGTERWQGRLAPGMAADLIVLPVDPFEIPGMLADLLPTATMVSGKWVWERE